MRTVILSVLLLAGCGETDCEKGCEDAYDDCVDEGQTEGMCAQQKQRCVQTCHGNEADQMARSVVSYAMASPCSSTPVVTVVWSA